MSALAGNRTRASRVAGENSTTEPPVLRIHVDSRARCLKGPENPNLLNR